MKNIRETMPRWPAYLMAAFAAACAVPAITISAPPPPDALSSDGRPAEWRLTMSNGMIEMLAQDGQRVSVPQPQPVATFDGRRYETDALVIDIVDRPCTDRHGASFAQQIMAVTDSHTLRGCNEMAAARA